MDYDFWKAEFEQWYERTNRLFVESRASMEMLDELRRRYEEATDLERRWIVELICVPPIRARPSSPRSC